MENVRRYCTYNTLPNAGMGIKFIGTGDGGVFWKKRRERNGSDGQRKNINRSDDLQVLRVVQHVDGAGVAVIVCTVRGNSYRYFENELHVEHS